MTIQSPRHPRPRRLAALAAGVAAALTLGASLPVAAAPLSPSTTAEIDVQAGRIAALPLDPNTPPYPEWPTFTDIDSNPFKEEIEWMGWEGFSTGWKTGPETAEYRPYAPILRDAMAAFISRMAVGEVTSIPQHAFTDISGAIFEKEMAWMYDYGVSTGWTEWDGTRTYRPFQPVLRTEMAAFLYRLAGSPPFTPPAVSPFTDVRTSHQFYKEITWLESTGITTGWFEPDGTRIFHPQRPILRDAMAAFLYRFASHPVVAVNATSAALRARTAGGTTYSTNASINCPAGQIRSFNTPGGSVNYSAGMCVDKPAVRTGPPQYGWISGCGEGGVYLYKPTEGWTYESALKGAEYCGSTLTPTWY